MIALQLLLSEFAITASDGAVWFAIGVGLLFGGVSLIFGVWVARSVGLLRSDAPAGETLGVGLACGLMVLAACWAAIWSGGRSSFTPVAVGFVIAIGLAVAHRVRRPPVEDAPIGQTPDSEGGLKASRSRRRRSLILTSLAGAVFVVAVALLYGSTMVLSPRDGAQPVEFNDEAFYAVLGRDLATTGTESQTLTSGFSEVPGLPAQTWYHWGELWLASAIIKIVGVAPLAARYFVVLPVVLLSAAALTGTLVRRLGQTNSRPGFVFGFLACLILAPMPLIPGPFFSSWATGLIFGITVYGLGAVAALLALYTVAVLDRRGVTWVLAIFVGSALAFILPAHIAVTVLALVGVGSALIVRVIRSLVGAGRPTVPLIWRQSLVAAAVVVGATAGWGIMTGHSLGGDSPSGPSPATTALPFNESWRASVAIVLLGAGAYFAIPIAWLMRWRGGTVQSDLFSGTIGLLGAGAIAWGALLGDFTKFYLFFAGIAVFATPVAAVAVRILWARLRRTGHVISAVALVILCVIQLELGAWNGMLRLQAFGPHTYQPIPLGLLEAIGRLPPDAKLAYSCGPQEESGFGVPQLLTIDAHVDHRVVPMCFESEILSGLIGGSVSPRAENLFFPWAPQRALYPDLTAAPSSAAVAAFMKGHGIDYIYSDAQHPNNLVGDAQLVAAFGDAAILRLP